LSPTQNKNCPVSKALAAIEIRVKATLEQGESSKRQRRSRQRTDNKDELLKTKK